jgi:1-acyl-sn-glycerol-3-phosphate acyltransferase
MCDTIPPAYEGPVPTKFLGKSTLFRFPIKSFIEYCGALPLARAMDSATTNMDKAARAAQNRATFEAAIKALQGGWPVAIYPEGVSLANPGLTLPLKPGTAKLALSAEEASGFGLGLRLIPVGLEYGSRSRVGSGLWIRYADPIPVAAYRALYESDPEQAVRQLTGDLERAMIGVYPHFLDETKLALGRKLVATGMSRSKYDAAQLFLRQQGNASFWEGLERRMRAFDEAIKDHGIPLPAWGHRQAWKQLGPRRRRWRMLALALGAPVFLLDLPNNSLPEFFLGSATDFFATDETERMSIRFILSPVVLGIVFALQFWFLRRFALSPRFAHWGVSGYVAYVFGSCVVWYGAVHWRRQFKRLASLFFFRQAGVDGRSESVARYRDLRQYLGQF